MPVGGLVSGWWLRPSCCASALTVEKESCEVKYQTWNLIKELRAASCDEL